MLLLNRVNLLLAYCEHQIQMFRAYVNVISRFFTYILIHIKNTLQKIKFIVKGMYNFYYHKNTNVFP